MARCRLYAHHATTGRMFFNDEAAGAKLGCLNLAGDRPGDRLIAFGLPNTRLQPAAFTSACVIRLFFVGLLADNFLTNSLLDGRAKGRTDP